MPGYAWVRRWLAGNDLKTHVELTPTYIALAMMSQQVHALTCMIWRNESCLSQGGKLPRNRFILAFSTGRVRGHVDMFNRLGRVPERDAVYRTAQTSSVPLASFHGQHLRTVLLSY